MILPNLIAPLIPIPPSAHVFQYWSSLDGTFSQTVPPSGAEKMTLAELPYQAAIRVYKNNSQEYNTIGWNVFKEGIKICVHHTQW